MPLLLRTPATQDPGLFHQLNQAMADVAKLHPLNDNIEEVLKIFYSFDTPEVSSLQPESPALSLTVTPTVTPTATPTVTPAVTPTELPCSDPYGYSYSDP